LLSTSGCKLPAVRPDRTSAWAQYTLMAPQRDRLQDALRARGIPTAVHYPAPVHMQPAYQAYGAGARFPASERAAKEVLSLPMHADLDETAQDRVADALMQALHGPADPR
jgi:UDP-2-acetamido-2-deoxy-ribo-hexuluronate aminotransferase